MGSLTRAERAEVEKLARDLAQEKADKVAAKRMALADKIVMALVDRVASDIIRPGPKAEERECYVMAQELREHTSHLSELVSAILEVEREEQG